MERISRWKSQVIPLPVGVYSVGRSKSAHLTISSKYCSRKLCRIIVDCESVSIFIEVSCLRFSLISLFTHDVCYTKQILIIFFSFVQEAKSVGGVYVNEKRFRGGRVSLKEHDKIGFGNPTNLSREVMALYGDEIHIYTVKSTIACSTDSNVGNAQINTKWIPSSVLPKLLAPARPPTPPKAPSEADGCEEQGKTKPAAVITASSTESHVVNVLNERAAAATDNNFTRNEKKCQFSNIVNFRLYDPEDPTDTFLED